MKCSKLLSVLVIVLLTAVLTTDPLLWPVAYAADISGEDGINPENGETRVIQINYRCFNQYGEVDKHFKTTRLRDGGSHFLNAAIDARDPELFITNCEVGEIRPQIECLNPELAYLEPTDDPTKWALKLVEHGDAWFKITIPGDGKYRTCTFDFNLRVLRHLQRIVMQGYLSYPLSDGGVQLDPGEYCHTDPIYESEDESIATVDEKGYVTFLSAGSTRINVTAPESHVYDEDTRTVNLTIIDPQNPVDLLSVSDDTGSAGYWESDTSAPAKTQTSVPVKTKASAVPAAKKAGGKLSRPKLKFKRLKRGNKLTWSKVSGAAGYEVYVRYPGKKKFVKAVRKSAKIKSVTHRGLSKGRVYSYKVRAFRKKGKTRKYGPFSKVVKVRVK